MGLGILVLIMGTVICVHGGTAANAAGKSNALVVACAAVACRASPKGDFSIQGLEQWLRRAERAVHGRTRSNFWPRPTV
ncbi:hypothetical protein UA11_05888 [Burkholderia multivorans]|nr:hypothetical protein UA11_05888 [Burkholderia multivorans]